MRLAIIGLFLALFLAGCASAPKYDVAATLGREFTLAEGQTAYMASEHLLVKFGKVSEDSRCPSDVVCVWAGQVKADVAVASGNFSAEATLVNSGGAGTAFEFSIPGGKSYSITLVSVAPYPKTTMPAKNYTATFVVSQR